MREIDAVPKFKLRFSRSEIEYWADCDGPDSIVELASIIESARQRGYLKRSDLFDVARWKSPRKAGAVSENDKQFVQEVTRFSLSSANESSRIIPLTSLSGVGWPTASVILHIFFEDKYPILDWRALESLGIPKPNVYTFSHWWSYVIICRSLAPQQPGGMRMLDRALWNYSRKGGKHR